MTDLREPSDKRTLLLARFEKATELPLLVLAVALIPQLIVPEVVDLPQSALDAIDIAGWLTWAAFAVDYVIRLGLTRHRWQFVKREWPDLLIILLPLLRPLRLAQSARALRLLHMVRLAGLLAEVNQESRRLLLRHNLHYVLMATLAVLVGAGALIAAVENGNGGSISTFSDGLWWAVTTITTVGYGDKFPVTAPGKGIAAFLMVAGITLFGLVTANLAARLVESRDDEDKGPSNAELMARIEQLSKQLDEMRTR